METSENVFEGKVSGLETLYSLEKLIEWKLWNFHSGQVELCPLYSLEKLIEWKRSRKGSVGSVWFSLYSLEKLIEWKRNKE